ncbi:5'-3' exonuclease [Salibacterium salarium]|uniref:5'-3' exonuclease n=1 Tax=Salibacterium salarium TaxID=284579 RepID=A0A428N4U4_9BACI|nr:5'-3' exonuclease [Salibacterium salarium]RSL33346.1 5'-3' exonuclease [Salibacterium salarium]
MNKDKVLLVDGMALLFRGFFATSIYGNFMYNDKGVPTNAVNGFIKYLLNALDTFQPTHVICCWDMGSKTFRTRLYPEYKANRSQPPKELIPQFDMAKQVMDSFEIPNVGVEDFEADDCIGTLAKQLAPQSSVYILTGDQDMLQLIDENITIAIMKKGRGNYQLYDETNLFEHKGCSPRQIIDMKGLMGDSSDNYPGVKGIGEKTALKLLNEYGTIETLLANMSNLPGGVKKKLEAEQDMLHLSRELAEIRIDAPVTYSYHEAMWTAAEETTIDSLADMGIKISLKDFYKNQETAESG